MAKGSLSDMQAKGEGYVKDKAGGFISDGVSSALQGTPLEGAAPVIGKVAGQIGGGLVLSAGKGIAKGLGKAFGFGGMSKKEKKKVESDLKDMAARVAAAVETQKQAKAATAAVPLAPPASYQPIATQPISAQSVDKTAWRAYAELQWTMGGVF